MPTLTAAELRARHETGLSDDDLDEVIAAELSVIEALYGPDATMTESYEFRRASGIHGVYQRDQIRRLVLGRPADSITTVTEVVGTTTTVLAADDYRLIQGYQLERLSDGTNGRLYWGDRVTIEYVPENDVALRKQVLIRLCQLNLAENGYLIEKTPEFTLQHIENYAAARASALRRLRKRPLLI